MLRAFAEMMPTRHRAAEPERVADRHHPVADVHVGGAAELDGLQLLVRRDLQKRDVGLGVLADQLRLELGAVVQIDLDLLGAIDHVVVGDDQAFLAVDDEAGAERGHRAVAAMDWPRLLKKSSKYS